MHTPRAATPTSTFSSSALHCLQSPLLFSFNCSSSSTLLFLPTPPLFFPLPLPSPSPPSALLCLLIFPPFLFPFSALLPPPSLLLLHSPPFHLPFFSPFLFLSPLFLSSLPSSPFPFSFVPLLPSHPLSPASFSLFPSIPLSTSPPPSLFSSHLTLPSIFTFPVPSPPSLLSSLPLPSTCPFFLKSAKFLHFLPFSLHLTNPALFPSFPLLPSILLLPFSPIPYLGSTAPHPCLHPRHLSNNRLSRPCPGPPPAT